MELSSVGALYRRTKGAGMSRCDSPRVDFHP
jgi:hypothetical protein